MKETRLWFLHIITGIIIFFLLGLHMIIMHLDHILGWFSPAGGKAVEWANVAARDASSMFAVIYVVLLGAALYHGLYGLRTILFELSLSKGLQKVISITFCLLGIILFIIGLYAAIAAKTGMFA